MKRKGTIYSEFKAGVTEAGTGRKNAGRLKELFKLFENRPRVLILIRPDPDSIAGALALKRLVLGRSSQVVIAYDEAIKRLQNLAMVSLLKIQIRDVRSISLDDFELLALVDGQRNHFPILARRRVDLCLDHHPVTEEYHYRFADIHPELGAASSLLAEYLQRARIRPSRRLATALCYGLKTDTDNFSRKVDRRDAMAFSWLFPLADYLLLQNIDQVEIPLPELEYFRLALDRLRVKRRTSFIHLGQVPDPDILVIIADFLIRVQGLDLVAVSGFEASRLTVIFRSSHPRTDLGRIVHAAFEPPGTAGGHKFMARAELKLEALPKAVRAGNADQVVCWLSDRIKLGRKLSGAHRGNAPGLCPL